MSDELRPAFSDAFAANAIPQLPALEPLDTIVTPEWAWGGSTGKGVKVAIIDSGVDADHPDIQPTGIQGYIAVRASEPDVEFDSAPHADAFGHGTACASFIRAVAPDCELYSIKVLGEKLSGHGSDFASGLRWAVDNGMNVCNLSLGTTKREFFSMLHHLADVAYFRDIVLVAASNNLPVASFPSVFASVISVACDDENDPFRFYYNPHPPAEFGAPGINLRAAWKGGWANVIGNSFAAPHITGLVARILSKHPGLTPFQVKGILRSLAANVGTRSTPNPGLTSQNPA